MAKPEARGALPSHWVPCEIGNMCTVLSGGTPSRSIPEYFNGDIMWLTPSQIDKTHIKTIYSSQERISKLGLANSAAKLIPPGAILLTTRASIGHVAIAGCELTTNQGFKSLVCKPHVCNYYLAYWLAANKAILDSISTGTTFKEVSMQAIKKLVVALPPIQQQCRIVDKIESIFAEIDSEMQRAADSTLHTTTLSHSLDNLKLSILDKAFRYDYYQNYRSVAQKTEKVHKLSDIAVINPKKPSRGSVLPDTDVSFVPMRRIEAETGKIESHIVKQYREVSKGYHYFQNDDILFAKITPCMENGKIALANNLTNGMGFATTEVYVIRLKNDGLLPKFYLWYLMQPRLRHRARQTMSGSAGQLRMPMAFLRDVAVPVPPLTEQRRVVERIESIFAKIDAEKAKIAKLQARSIALSESVAQVKKSILHLAFSGKLLPELGEPKSA